MSDKISFGLEFDLGDQGQSAERQPDTPFHILLLGDFSGRANRGIRRPDKSTFRKIEVDRDNFEEVMERLKVCLDRVMVVEGESSVSLEFQELEHFEPDYLFDELSIFSNLRDLRNRLLSSSTFRDAADEVMSWTEYSAKPAPKPPEKAENSVGPDQPVDLDNFLDSIQDQPNGGVSMGSSSQTEWQQLMADIVSPYISPSKDPRQDELVKCVDNAIQATMIALLHHPSFRQLEANWRALNLITRNVDTDSTLKIFMVDVSKQEISDDLNSSDDLTSTQLYRLIVEQTQASSEGIPWSVIAGSYYFDDSEEDVSILGRLAKIAAAAKTSFLSSVSEGRLGRNEDCPELETVNRIDSDSWAVLRALPEAKHLSMVWPRFLLRLPYGSKTSPVDRFEFEEIPNHENRSGLIWGNPVFLLATQLGQAFSQSGWNASTSVRMEYGNLPVWIYQQDGETAAHPCGEYLLTDKNLEALHANGISPLISLRDRDRIAFDGVRSLKNAPLPIFD